MASVSQLGSSVRSIGFTKLVSAFGTGIFPAIGAYFTVSFATADPQLLVLWVSWLVFGVAFYRHESFSNQVGAGLFWLAIEAFLFPIAILGFTFVFVSGQSDPLVGAGGALAGGILFFVLWFVMWLVGVVLYLISNRFGS